MCNKSNVTKRFFVLLNHPNALRKAIPMTVLKDAPHLQSLYESCRNTVFLTPSQVESLGIKPPNESNMYLVPIVIPREWFLH